MEAHVALAQVHAYDGEMGAAIAQFEAARHCRIAQAAVPDLIRSLESRICTRPLDNDVFRAPGDRCLLSVRKGVPGAEESRGLRQGH